MSKRINDGNFSDIDRYSLEQTLVKYQIQPAGAGFSQLIVSPQKAIGFINRLTELDVLIEMVSWWCLCLSERMTELGCPHGIGGPQNRFGDGWFSECVQYPDFSYHTYHKEGDLPFSSNQRSIALANELVSAYLSDSFPKEGFYSQCLHYGFWLRVPKSWQRAFYFT